MSTIREQNDRIRAAGAFGPDTDTPLMITPGVQALGDEAIGFLYQKCMQFQDFDEEDAPDHDLGVIDLFGTEVWFKIDVAADGGRIFTFLLPDEY